MAISNDQIVQTAALAAVTGGAGAAGAGATGGAGAATGAEATAATTTGTGAGTAGAGATTPPPTAETTESLNALEGGQGGQQSLRYENLSEAEQNAVLENGSLVNERTVQGENGINTTEYTYDVDGRQVTSNSRLETAESARNEQFRSIALQIGISAVASNLQGE